jgi:glycosyltransferase involved in cell wall biosynthesis
MKILAIYRHYWPDATPYARILRAVLAHLSDGGHEPVVWTAQPGYNDIQTPRQPRRETIDGVQVRRMRLLPERKRLRWLRGVNFAWFLLRAVLHATLGGRYDLIIANSHPPILMGCALRLIRAVRGTPYIYHCQDIHPESAALAGNWRRSGLFRSLRRLDKAACRGARHVIVLSRDMSDALALRGLSTENVAVINNAPLGRHEFDAGSHGPRDNRSPVATEKLLAECGLTCLEQGAANGEPIPPVRFLFAGNLGRFQGLDRLVEAARLIMGARFQLIFMGEGTKKASLIEQAGDLAGERIIFLPHQPLAVALAAMRACDYGVVSLLPNVYRYAFPSKVMTYLSAGCPLLAVIEPESELSRTIVRYDLGYVARGRSVADVAAAMLTATAERAKWTPGRRRAIQQTCAALYGEAGMLTAWDRLVPPVRISPLEFVPTASAAAANRAA